MFTNVACGPLSEQALRLRSGAAFMRYVFALTNSVFSHLDGRFSHPVHVSERELVLDVFWKIQKFVKFSGMKKHKFVVKRNIVGHNHYPEGPKNRSSSRAKTNTVKLPLWEVLHLSEPFGPHRRGIWLSAPPRNSSSQHPNMFSPEHVYSSPFPKQCGYFSNFCFSVLS